MGGGDAFKNVPNDPGFNIDNMMRRRFSESLARKDSNSLILQSAPPSTDNNNEGEEEVKCTCPHPEEQAKKLSNASMRSEELERVDDVNGIMVCDELEPVDFANYDEPDEDEVEEGGDIEVDQEVLAQAILNEPELLSCISEGNCASIVAAAAANEVSQTDNGLCMISEEDEEVSLKSPSRSVNGVESVELRKSSTAFEAKAEITTFVWSYLIWVRLSTTIRLIF